MAEKKGVGHAYNIDFLNVVFAASSIFLFVSVVWMVWDDYDRDWKNTQREFALLEYEVTQASLEQASGAVDQAKLTDLETRLAAAQQNVAANQEKVDELRASVATLDARLYREQQAYQFAKATYDQDKYTFEAARAAGASNADRLGEEVTALGVRMNELLLIWEASTAERAALQRQLEELTGEVGAIQKTIAEMRFDENRLRTRLGVIAPSPVKTYFRDAPLLDFMAPTLRVRQVILPNIVDDVNFTRVPKMDRCQTCHLAIDRQGYEEYPQPFKTHPNLDQYLGSGSPHPLDQIGCTVCHEGQGQSVSFQDAYHTPATEEQGQAWEEQYGWHASHFWDFPMLPKGLTEASCAKCHKQETFIPGAEALNAAYATYERAGCYACHKTRGFEGLRKPGPILTKIDAKLTPEWVKTWIRNPKAVKPTTWMPKVWYNSNSNSPEDAVRNEAEIDAVVAYLFANTDPHAPAVRNPARGSADRGEQVVRNVGCLGCHVVDDEVRSDVGTRRTFGQPLENIGAKTTYEWIYDWVRDPNHYSPGTYMPDLRLTDAEVADVATYLSSLRGEAGEPAPATADQAATDAVLLEYLRSVMPFEEAKAHLSKLDARAKQLELGQRAISRYGCFSCHDIKGFENAQPIGTDLSEAGSKLVSRLDFAFVHDIPHTKTAWYSTKLRNPRIFDQGRVLQPLEKLRMPNFDFTDAEVQRLLTALMSFQVEIQRPQAMPVRTAQREFLVQGRSLVQRRNCVGCHVIEGTGGDYVDMMSDPSLGPPLLTPTGARVQHDWLYAFLRAPITIRPWLAVRMPTFGLDDQNLNGLISYFGAVSDELRPFRTHAVVNASSANLGVGKQLFELLRCQQCHVLGAIPRDQETSNLAPDLRMASDRLQADWIADWMRTPAQIQPGTRMPAFWPQHPQSFYPHLGGDAEAQIQAVRDYLLTLRGGPSPRPGAARSAN